MIMMIMVIYMNSNYDDDDDGDDDDNVAVSFQEFQEGGIQQLDRLPAILEPSWRSLKQWKQNNRNSFAQKVHIASHAFAHWQLKVTSTSN